MAVFIIGRVHDSGDISGSGTGTNKVKADGLLPLPVIIAHCLLHTVFRDMEMDALLEQSGQRAELSNMQNAKCNCANCELLYHGMV